MDLNSISVDLDASSTVETQSTSNPLRTQTTDFGQILRRIAGINTSFIPCMVICVAFDLIFTLISLVMGSSNISACPIERQIPIYLVVSSIVNLASIFFTILACVLHVKEKDDNMIGFFCVMSAAVTIIILQIFLFIWLIIGTVWLASIFNQVEYNFLVNPKKYCQQNLYQYTFISIILQYIIPVIMCCCKNATFIK